MKKEKPLPLVIFCMFILLLFIIAPPVFRSLIPKKEVTKKSTSNNIELLKCNKTFSDGNLGSSTSKYVNQKIFTNTIKLTNNHDINSDTVTDSNIGIDNTIDNQKINTDNNANSSSINNITFDIEYQRLINIENENVVINDKTTTIVIDSKVMKNNQNNEEIKNYFQDIDNQKSFYESMGYTCQIIK